MNADAIVALAETGSVLDWKTAIDAAFTLSPDEREAVLRRIRPLYEGRLTPQFHAVPWGDSLHERATFRAAYTSAAALTNGFTQTTEADLLRALETDPTTLIVFRLILGYTTAELSAALELVKAGDTTLQEINRVTLVG